VSVKLRSKMVVVQSTYDTTRLVCEVDLEPAEPTFQTLGDAGEPVLTNVTIVALPGTYEVGNTVTVEIQSGLSPSILEHYPEGVAGG
jgi:hypothetical protein